jgi:hypothetical protein
MKLAVLAFCVVVLPGCLSTLQKACIDVMPTLTAAQTYGPDAIAAIDQAVATVSSLPLAADVKAALDAAVGDARTGVEIGEAGVSAAIGLCQAKDAAEAYAVLIAAWTRIEAIIAGNDAAKLKLAQRPLYVPAVVRLARMHAAH